MKFTVILAWIALATTLSAAPKFGVVRVTDIYRGLPSTAAMQQKMQSEREAILKNTRAERLRTSIAEMEAIESQLRAVKDELDTEDGKKLIRAYEIKRQEVSTLRQAFEEYRAEEDKRINTDLVAATRASLNRISAAAQQIAKERNLDGVFDTSGNSNTGVPLLLYAAKAEDLTDDVIGLLGEKPVVEGEEATEAAEAEAGGQSEAVPEPE